MADQLTRDDVLRWLQQDQAWGVLVAPTEWRPVDDEWLNLIHRAVLTRWGNPAPPPADGEVAELVEMLKGIAYWKRHGKPGEPAPTSFDIRQADRLDRAAELLERQALVPVSISERLPGPEVCVPHPRTKRGNWCWGFERCEVSLARPARWRLMHMETVEMEASHWLPAHALPLPEVNNG